MSMPTVITEVVGEIQFRFVSGERREAENSDPSSAYVKNEWNCTSTPAYAFTICTERALNFTLFSVEYGLWLICVSNRTSSVFFKLLIMQ